MINKYYSPNDGIYKGKRGLMVSRFADPSYNDICLRFEDGEECWFKFNTVTFLEGIEPPKLVQSEDEWDRKPRSWRQ